MVFYGLIRVKSGSQGLNTRKSQNRRSKQLLNIRIDRLTIKRKLRQSMFLKIVFALNLCSMRKVTTGFQLENHWECNHSLLCQETQVIMTNCYVHITSLDSPGTPNTATVTQHRGCGKSQSKQAANWTFSKMLWGRHPQKNNNTSHLLGVSHIIWL